MTAFKLKHLPWSKKDGVWDRKRGLKREKAFMLLSNIIHSIKSREKWKWLKSISNFFEWDDPSTEWNEHLTWDTSTLPVWIALVIIISPGSEVYRSELRHSFGCTQTPLHMDNSYITLCVSQELHKRWILIWMVSASRPQLWIQASYPKVKCCVLDFIAWFKSGSGWKSPTLVSHGHLVQDTSFGSHKWFCSSTCPSCALGESECRINKTEHKFLQVRVPNSSAICLRKQEMQN